MDSKSSVEATCMEFCLSRALRLIDSVRNQQSTHNAISLAANPRLLSSAAGGQYVDLIID